mgnify:CR=1 FL=1
MSMNMEVLLQKNACADTRMAHAFEPEWLTLLAAASTKYRAAAYGRRYIIKRYHDLVGAVANHPHSDAIAAAFNGADGYDTPRIMNICNRICLPLIEIDVRNNDLRRRHHLTR